MSEFELAPAVAFKTVTPSDTVDISPKARAFYVGTTGDLVLVNEFGTAVKFAAVPAGALMPIYSKRVNATGTTAGDIVALF